MSTASISSLLKLAQVLASLHPTPTDATIASELAQLDTRHSAVVRLLLATLERHDLYLPKLERSPLAAVKVLSYPFAYSAYYSNSYNRTV